MARSWIYIFNGLQKPNQYGMVPLLIALMGDSKVLAEREMDQQGFDPMEESIPDVVAFMEHIE